MYLYDADLSLQLSQAFTKLDRFTLLILREKPRPSVPSRIEEALAVSEHHCLDVITFVFGATTILSRRLRGTIEL